MKNLPLIAAKLQQINTDVQTAYGMLSPILRFDKEIPAHASLTYQTFCVFLVDIQKQVNLLVQETIGTNERES